MYEHVAKSVRADYYIHVLYLNKLRLSYKTRVEETGARPMGKLFFSFWFLINYVDEISLHRLVYLIWHTFGYLIKILMLTQCDNN